MDEDAALKTKLGGISVVDLKAPAPGRTVPVYYRFPQKEWREVTYPFITLDLVAINEALDRAHRGEIYMRYVPEGFTVTNTNDPDTKILTDFPIPVDLIYTATTWARFPEHDRQIQAAMLGNGKIPFRFGWLEVRNTIRRLDNLGLTPADTIDENRKTLFRKIYTMRVSAELFPGLIAEVARVRKVVLNMIISTVSQNTEMNETLPPMTGST